MIAEAKGSILFLDSVSKCYRGNRNTPFSVDDFTLKMSSGDLVRLRGKSGSGKSTIIRIAGLLTQPDSGAVYICGKPSLSSSNRDQLRSAHIGIVFQENHLFKHLTVIENLRIADLSPYRPHHYKKLLEQFGIAHLAQVKATNLSGGELQRAGICRAIINDPQLLLLDEPTSSLDDDAADGVLEAIRMMHQEGVAILVASHDSRLDGLETHSVLLNEEKHVR